MTNFIVTARVSVALFTNETNLPDPNGVEMVKTVTVTERHVVRYIIDKHEFVAVKEFDVSQTKKPSPIPKPINPAIVPKPIRRP